MSIGDALPGAGVCGEGDAGEDEPIPAASMRRATPAAVLWDPELRYTLLDGDGRPTEIHPVDAWVIYQLGLEYGSIPASPATGNRIRKALAAVSADQRQQTAYYETRVALQQGIDAGDVELLSVEVDVPRKDLVTTRYRNRKLSDDRTLIRRS